MTEMNEVTRKNYQSVIDESPWAYGMTPEEMKAEVDRFKDEACFCKEVTTPNGRALLINGEVITIVSNRPAFHVDAISRALRERNMEGFDRMASGTLRV